MQLEAQRIIFIRIYYVLGWVTVSRFTIHSYIFKRQPVAKRSQMVSIQIPIKKFHFYEIKLVKNINDFYCYEKDNKNIKKNRMKTK